MPKGIRIEDIYMQQKRTASQTNNIANEIDGNLDATNMTTELLNSIGSAVPANGTVTPLKTSFLETIKTYSEFTLLSPTIVRDKYIRGDVGSAFIESSSATYLYVAVNVDASKYLKVSTKNLLNIPYNCPLVYVNDLNEIIEINPLGLTSLATVFDVISEVPTGAVTAYINCYTSGESDLSVSISDAVYNRYFNELKIEKENLSNTFKEELFPSVIRDKCGLIEDYGSFHNEFLLTSVSGILEDSTFEYKRNGVASKKITAEANDSTTIVIETAINAPINTVALLAHFSFEDKSIINEEGCSVYLYLMGASKSISNAYNITLQSSLHNGWFTYSFPISDFNIVGTLAQEDIKYAMIRIVRGATNTSNFSFYVNAIINDMKMRPIIMVNHDQVWEQDIEVGGKFDILETYDIPVTIFDIGTHQYITNDTLYNRVHQLVSDGKIEIGLYGAKEDSAINIEYNVNYTKEILYSNEYPPKIQYNQLKLGLGDIKNNFISEKALGYAASTGLMTSRVIQMLKELGFKIARENGRQYISFFGIDDFSVGASVTIYTADLVADIKAKIDYAISNGYSISLFTHYVDNTAYQYGCDAVKFDEIMSYIASKRDTGLCDIMTFSQFLNACLNS